ncbi:MAG TPA: AAA family ATPase, partial [Spirochaetota bacterium]|nr:AAA family ATPase [Spirochaetota bacterium]
KVSYIAGIADQKFVYEEKIVIQYYFWIILDNTKKEEIIKIKNLLENEESFAVEFDRLKKESDIFFKEKISKFEHSKDIKTENLKELENIKQIDVINNGMIYDRIISSLYRFASYIIKADNEVNDKEVKCLKELWLKLYSIDDVNTKIKQSISVSQILQSVNELTSIGSNNLEKNLEELNKLVGLKSVKEELISLINFLKIKKLREEKKLSTANISLHSVFLGNPGTGKTMVARILGAIYKDIGLLKSGHLIESDRSKFVADFIGQTSSKTDKLIDTALDGVLFIDEAYSLISPGTENDFGHEAVSILLKRMEDNRDRLIVIVAGYPNEMKKFLELNPGLKSRFNRYFNFPDYTPDELTEILEFLCNKLEYVLTQDAKEKVLKIMNDKFSKKDKYFGNGRLARNLFENTIKNHSNRIVEIAPVTKEILTYLRPIDVPDNIDSI